MKCLTSIIMLVLLLNYSLGKETVIYQATGAELIDLIRGRPPKEGALKLTKVEGKDRANLPDGIYYEPPEDEVLGGPESSYLYLKGNGEKTIKNHETSEIPEEIK